MLANVAKLQAGAALTVAALVAAVLFWKRKEIASSAEAVVSAFNPASPDNLAYRGVTAITEKITGDDRPFGVQLFEWMNPGVVKAEIQAIHGSDRSYTQPAGLRELRQSELLLYEGPGGAAFGVYPKP